MKEADLVARITAITTDDSKSIDDRIDEVFHLRENLTINDNDLSLHDDIICLTSLIEMIKCDQAASLHSLDLLQLYVLLAETYVAKKDFRPLKKLAGEVIDQLRFYPISWHIIDLTVPRIIDAVSASVYNHALFALLVLYIRAAFRDGMLNSDLKGRVRRMLKLRLHIEYSYWNTVLDEAELQAAIAAIFSPEELLKILLNPTIGSLAKDPVEYTRHWEDIYYDVEDRLEDRFANAPRQMGFCFLYWNAKRELLKEEYNIEWRSPAIMNPSVMFD